MSYKLQGIFIVDNNDLIWISKFAIDNIRIFPAHKIVRFMNPFQALRFTERIQNMGQMLVDRMRAKDGRYIALHLRLN